MLNEYGGEITADLLRFYGVDIRDLFTGGLSPRRALALVENLPIESATVSNQISEGERSSMGWGRDTYVMADLIDAINVLHATLVRVNHSNPKKVKDPDPYERPGTKERTRKAKTINPFASALTASETVEVDAGGEIKSFSISPDILKRSQKGESEGQPFAIN